MRQRLKNAIAAARVHLVRFLEVSAPVLDHRAGLVALLYLLAIWKIFSAWTVQSTQPSYVAATTLYHNHRIATTDLKPGASVHLGFYLPDRSTLEGRYVKPAFIPAGSVVVDKVLSDQPELQLRPSTVAIELPLSAESRLSRVLDAGAEVVLGGADGDEKKTAFTVPSQILALLCVPAEKSAQPACNAILEVPASSSGLILKNKAALQLALAPGPEKPKGK